MQKPRKAPEGSVAPCWPLLRAWPPERLYWQIFGAPALTDAVRTTRRYAQDFPEAPPKRHLDAFEAGYAGRAYDGPDSEAYEIGHEARFARGAEDD